jgi:sterol desaturase/sphingolipid hydroxylase (fatty acid hydroxylase superfamily)
MNHDHVMQRNYGSNFSQSKCRLVFAGIFIPIVFLDVWVRTYSEVLFHVLLFLTGWFTWTFTEYIGHRFTLHKKAVKNPTSLVKTHVYHHSHPTEISITPRNRLYMTLVAVLICITAFYLRNFFTYIAGIYFGGFGYILLHRFLHTKWAGIFAKRLYRQHVYHHCKYPDACFGVCTTFWDRLFGTMQPKNAIISPRIWEFYKSGQDAHH